MLTVAAPSGVLANDIDVDHDHAVSGGQSSRAGPAHGTLTLNADGSFTYLGATDYNGADSF